MTDKPTESELPVSESNPTEVASVNPAPAVDSCEERSEEEDEEDEEDEDDEDDEENEDEGSDDDKAKKKAKKEREKQDKKAKKEQDKKDKKDKKSKKKVEFEASMPRTEAVSYFEAIVAGLRSGRLEFKQANDTLVLSPPDQVEVEVTAKLEGDKAKVSFEICWRNDNRALEILS